MPQILRTVLLPNEALDAAGETDSIDLPVNPLSAIIVTLRALNNSAAVTTYSAFQAFFDKLTNLNVKYRGATIIDGTSLDLAVMYAILAKWFPKQGQINSLDNDVRSITFPLLFGRKPYDPKQCFPATRRGDLILEWTAAADAATGLDNFTMEVESVELLDAQPESFLKITTTDHLMIAGDVNDISLPIGNKLLGLLLRAETFPTGASQDSSFNQMALEVDNVEVGYSRTFWESLHGEMGRLLPPGFAFESHTHDSDLAAAYTQFQDTAEGKHDAAVVQQYAYMDFDPTMDGMYALDTQGAADINLHVDSDVADATGSAIMPVELVPVAGASAAA